MEASQVPWNISLLIYITLFLYNLICLSHRTLPATYVQSSRYHSSEISSPPYKRSPHPAQHLTTFPPVIRRKTERFTFVG
jgi:hypothetical protein